MFLCFSREGLNSNKPLRMQHTMVWAPKEEWLDNSKMEEMALLAVLIALFPTPLSQSSARTFIPSSTEGQIGFMPCVPQWPLHFWRYSVTSILLFGSCLWKAGTSGIESGTVSCAIDGVPVGCWEQTEFLCLFRVVLVAGSTFALTLATMVELAISDIHVMWKALTAKALGSAQ